MTTKTETLAAVAERCYREMAWDALAELYADDVLLDMHPPGWRFQLQGRDAVAEWWHGTVSAFTDFRVAWVRATPTAGGVVIEWEMHTGSGDDAHQCRQVDILHGDGERIHEHAIWCGGMWDADTIARQRSEAPMIRP